MRVLVWQKCERNRFPFTFGSVKQKWSVTLVPCSLFPAALQTHHNATAVPLDRCGSQSLSFFSKTSWKVINHQYCARLLLTSAQKPPTAWSRFRRMKHTVRLFLTKLEGSSILAYSYHRYISGICYRLSLLNEYIVYIYDPVHIQCHACARSHRWSATMKWIQRRRTEDYDKR